MPRISMQQAYDNRDVIAQIYKMMAEVADALEKATDAVSKALEAIEAAEDAGEAAEAAQQTADGKQDALTAEQLAAVDSGITTEGVTQIGTNATAIEGLDERTEILASTADANVGDALMLDENKVPVWGISRMTAHTYATWGDFYNDALTHTDGLISISRNQAYSWGIQSALHRMLIVGSRITQDSSGNTSLHNIQTEVRADSGTSVTANIGGKRIANSSSSYAISSIVQTETWEIETLKFYY